MKIACLIVLSFLVQATFAGVYKWTDAEGRVHYSDRPVSGAEVQEIALPAPSPPEQGEGDEDGGEDAQDVEDAASAIYDELAIVSPEEDQTVRSDNGSLDLSLVIRPPLQGDHTIRIEIDGAPITGTVEGTQLSVSGVPYGSHRIQVTIVDDQDQPFLLVQACNSDWLSDRCLEFNLG